MFIGLYTGNLINKLCDRLSRMESIVDILNSCRYSIKKGKLNFNIELLNCIQFGQDCPSSRETLNIRSSAIEMLCAGLFVLCDFAQPTSLVVDSNLITTLLGCGMIALLLPLIILDIDYLLLPNLLCRVGTISGWIVTFLIGSHGGMYSGFLLLLGHSIASFLGLILFRSLSCISNRILGKESLGFGDANLSAFLGAWLGVNGLLLSIVIAFVAAGLFSVIGLIAARMPLDKPFPFGPFLASSGYLVWYFGNEFWIKIITPF